MTLSNLNAISPIDGRYREKVEKLASYFSEQALIKYRIQTEIEYFIALVELPLPQLKNFKPSQKSKLREIYTMFTHSDAENVKDIEKRTCHDVKSVEYFIKDKFDAINLSDYKEFIHFGLTSQDINNTAIPLSMKHMFEEVFYEQLAHIISTLKKLADKWKHISMLGHTHGQPASPTKMGKEISVFIERIKQQIKLLKRIPFAAKFGGSTGNYNAHCVAYPDIDWKSFATDFIQKKLRLHHSFPTTQIEHYDHISAIFDNVKRINNIIIDLNRDFWFYISMNYFKQKIEPDEIGSSTMPHKINPIDFENSEGNLGIANAIFEHLSAKLPISRLQRDLTDSTVLRNIGVPFGHTLIAFSSTLKGLNKLLINHEAIDKDLENNWVIVTEAIQTILRRENYPNPYETVKKMSRTNKKMDKQSILDFIDSLKLTDEIKKELKNITPNNYTGI